jgi:hypothetical protein
MTRSFACLFAVALALAGAGPAVISASEPRPVADVDIIVGGTPQKRYVHDGRWYVEALTGREYAIRLRNPYGVRVAVALSVDGLNTIDAQHTTAAGARKWVIEPYQSITISGWQTSDTAARRFEFTTEERSYAQALGRPSNTGVISAVFFRERQAVILRDGARKQDRAGSGAPAPAAPAQEAAADSIRGAREEYAATGMGRQTDHAVRQIRLDLEDTPAQRVDIRYEYRPQLVRLGILPAAGDDPLRRRERAKGFEPGFSPVPPHLH